MVGARTAGEEVSRVKDPRQEEGLDKHEEEGELGKKKSFSQQPDSHPR